MKTTCRVLGILMLMGGILFSYQPARADVAPPEAPPGSNILPGGETTQVSMLAEQVTLNVYADPSDSTATLAKTTAVFTMRNQGTEAEQLQVRFPLRFMMWEDNTYPEIANLQVKVNGKSVPTHRELLKYTDVRELWSQEVEIPWSVFDVNFPPSEDISIEVSYTVHGFGYDPYRAFRYVLETGAGWNGNIGSADIVVQLPYEADRYNVLLQEETGFSSTTAGAQLQGNEVRWHFENFEPSSSDNMEISLVMPSLWQAILRERATVAENPRDGEAWGRLGKDYKQISRGPKGFARDDTEGYELYQLSSQAYEKCLALLPEDSQWHAGYAELLWTWYYFSPDGNGVSRNPEVLRKLLDHLHTAVQLDPNNELANQLLDEVYYAYPEAVRKTEDGYDLLGLTAIPATQTHYVVETPTTLPATQTPGITPTATKAIEDQPVTVTVQPTAVPPAGKSSPLCGGAAVVVAGAVVVVGQRRRRGRGER